MSNNKAKKAFKQIAKKEGVSIASVRHEIAIAIAEARNNPDPKIQAAWKTFPARGAIPRRKN